MNWITLRSLLTLLLALFLDGIGVTLLFPVLNNVLLIPNESILSPDVSTHMRYFIYALTLGFFYVCWFFGTAIISDLSDDLGRKKTLMFSLAGSGFGYLLTVLALFYKSITLLLLGRIIDGLTLGSQPIAQAAMVDISSDTQVKRKLLTYSLLAPSIGFIIGPLLSGVLINKDLISWFGPIIPMLVATILSFLNVVMIYFFFHETRAKTSKVEINFARAVGIFTSAFLDKNIRYLETALLMLSSAWGSFFSYVSLFLAERHHFSATQTGFYMASLGIGFTLYTSFLSPMIARFMSLRSMIISGSLLSSFFIVWLAQTESIFTVWGLSIILGLVAMMAFACLLNLLSDQVDENAQGWIMGVNDSMIAFSFILSNITSGLFIQKNITIPFYSAGLFFAICAFMILFQPKKNKHLHEALL